MALVKDFWIHQTRCPTSKSNARLCLAVAVFHVYPHGVEGTKRVLEDHVRATLRPHYENDLAGARCSTVFVNTDCLVAGEIDMLTVNLR